MKANIKFTFLTGDVNWRQYGGKWISQKLNNGEFDYWAVIELINMWDATGEEDQPQYVVELSIVSPAQAGRENCEKACQSCGMEYNAPDSWSMVEMLHSYGIHAVLYSSRGNNAYKLLREVKHEAQIQAGMMFGFAMDRPENRIGSTGWEMLRGDINSALSRTIASGTPEGRILGKMYGIE